MICSKCSNQINTQMNFCPYCGTRHRTAVKITDIAYLKREIEQLSKDNKYDDILDIAIQGNIIAKTFYINHIRNFAQAHRGYNYKNVPELQKLQSLCLQNHAFGSAAYGIFLYENSDAKIQAWDSKERNPTKAEGISLIKKSAESREAAAITVLGEWTSQGINGTSKDEFTAYRLIKEAAEQFYAPAMYLLGLWHYKGINGASKKEDIGYMMIEKAAFAGDADARKLILQNDDQWFQSEIGFTLPNDDIKRLQNISESICNPDVDSTNDNISVAEINKEIEACRSIADYIKIYKSIQKPSVPDSNKKAWSDWLNSMISSIIGIPLTDCSAVDIVKLKNDYRRAIELIKKYTSLPHFLHLKEDLERIGIHFEEVVIDELMNQASKLIRAKCPKTISSGISYKAATSEIEKSGFTFGMVIFSIIIAVVLSYFFGTVGIVIGIIIVLSAVMSWTTTKKNKRIASETKENYQLINAIIAYGYSPFEPYQEDNFQYDENAVYVNKTPSILDVLPKSELSGLFTDNAINKTDGTQVFRCPKCGTENKAAAKFCKSCGTPIK